MRQKKDKLILTEKNPKRDYYGIMSVEWGDKKHCEISKVNMKMSNLKITNRFDFGNDTDMLIRNIKPINKKIPNIFGLLQKEKKEQ